MKKDLFDDSDTLEWVLNVEPNMLTYNRIYSREVIDNALKEFVEHPSAFVITGTTNDDDTIPLVNVVAIVENYRIEEDNSIKIYVKPVASGKYLPDNMTVSLVGYGSVDTNNEGNDIISALTITVLTLQPEPLEEETTDDDNLILRF